MRIRKAVPSDAAIIADFNIRLAWETEQLKLDSETVRRGVEAVLKDASKGIYFVAELPDAGVAGQLMITYEWSDWRNGNIWWIQSVYVSESFRGRGLFQGLFKHLEQMARESKDVCALRLYMDIHNDSARRAYKKMGMDESNYVVFDKTVGGSGGEKG